jgi:hypothetical protein
MGRTTHITKRKAYRKEKFYAVSGFCGTRTDPISCQRQVLVRWKGYPMSASTWEPYEQLVEDGWGPQLDAVADNPQQSYLLVVRFQNTRSAPSTIYQSLRQLLDGYGGKRSVQHMPGNTHIAFSMTDKDVKSFTMAFREWLARYVTLGCAHAQLFRITKDEGQLSVYPPIEEETSS